MKGDLILSLVLSPLLFLRSEASPVTCSSPGVECEYTEASYIDTITGVNSEEECRAVCGNQEGCSFITFFNASASPVANACRSFASCDTVVPCDNCVTQNMTCFETCGTNAYGKMDENVIDVLSGIKSESEC